MCKIKQSLSLSVCFLLLTTLIHADEQPAYIHFPTVPSAMELDVPQSVSPSLFTGAAVFSYPVEVPLGTNGLTPSISLNYNSQMTTDRPTIVGTAWSMSESYIQRDTEYTRDTLSDDTFRLNMGGSSQKLVYDSSDGWYHSKTESYLKISKLTGGANAKGDYWLVQNSDGTKYRFGYVTSSEQVSNLNSNMVVRWYLDTITDIHGNNMTYTYSENPFGSDIGATYLDKIEYNNDKSREIKFAYETSNRPDLWYVIEEGNKIQESRRLKDISVYADSSLVRRYSLTYHSSGLNTRRSIIDITIYGSDNVSSLPPTEFEYYGVTKGWTLQSGKTNPNYFIRDDAENSYDQGVRLADLDGDGLIDFIKYFKDYLHRSVTDQNINTGSGFTDTSDWSPPKPIIYEHYSNNAYDRGVRVLDVNGDGLADFSVGIEEEGSSCSRYTYINDGDSFELDSNWAIPTCVINEDDYDGIPTYDQGVAFVDINGDGMVDVVKGMDPIGGNCDTTTWLNNGNGWTSTNNFDIPHCIIDQDSGYCDYQGVRIVDINGDGLADSIYGHDPYSDSCETQVRINNGEGWTHDSTIDFPSCIISDTTDAHDLGVRIADVNGDGLADVVRSIDSSRNVWINIGNDWSLDTGWIFPRTIIDDDDDYSKDQGVRLADINGDQIVDVLQSYDYHSQGNSNYIYYGNPSHPFLLKKIIYPHGGYSEFDYTKSTSLDNTGSDTQSDLPFNVWVVGSIVTNNGMDNDHETESTVAYSYQDGYYDISDQEFRGFGFAKVTDANSITSTWFHQSEALQGRDYLTEITDKQDDEFYKEEKSWSYNDEGGYYTVHLDEVSSYVIDEVETGQKITNTTYDYDIYSNVNKTSFLGDISIQGDEHYNLTEYVYSTSLWILNTPSRQYTLDSDETKIKETKYYYDEKDFGDAPAKGDVTKIQFWYSSGSDSTLEYGYDSYGNVLNQTDSLGNVMHYGYDSTHTFVTETTNPLSQEVTSQYDLGTGNLLSQEDANGFTTTFDYDVFGRITKEILPYDSSSYPTKSYSYNDTLPRSVEVSLRITSGQSSTVDSISFYDGLGRIIQSKKEGPDCNRCILQ